MNPPYGDLALKILSQTQNDFPDSRIISLQPCRWITDSLWIFKKNSDANKYRKQFENKFEIIKFIHSHEAQHLFSAKFNLDIAIFLFDKNTKFDYEQYLFKRYKEINEINPDSLKNHIEDKSTNYYIPIASMGGGEPTRDTKRMICGCVYKKKSKNNFRETDGINFNTQIEADNFYDACETNTYKWLCFKLSGDSAVALKYLPFFNDYKEKWNDDKIQNYLKITEEEKKEIEFYSKYFNKGNTFHAFWLKNQL